MIGPMITTTQAPSVNLTVAKMRTISAVKNAEMALTTTPRRHFGPRASKWCLIIPAPAMAKPVNTPMA